MADVHAPEIRSRNMAAIRSVNTQPELALRRALFAIGYRYRLHGRTLPGRPDLVFAKHRAVIFVHGCFFHGHECPIFRWPATRREFWRTKIEGNRRRDAVNLKGLRDAGWRVLIVWECALRGSGKLAQPKLASQVSQWLKSPLPVREIAGSTYQ